MVVKGKKIIKSCYKIMLFIVGFFLCPLEVDAKGDFSDYASVRHPLIQATNVVEEYEALETLGFFDTGVAKIDVKSTDETENVQETEQVELGEAEDAHLPEYSDLLHRLHRETAYEKAKACIVQINMGTYYGSGIIWDLQNENIIIVSNTHLLQNGQSGRVTFCSGVSVDGKVLETSDNTDIGFMEVPLSSLAREDWLLLRFADKNEENYQLLLPGDEIFVIGSATGTGQDYYEGTIGNVSYYFPEFGANMLYGYCEAVPGMSGGGTFDKEGHFIGMLTAGTENGEIASLPLETMLEEYEKVIKYPLNNLQ